MNEENLYREIEKMIFTIRGQRVMLDSDLAKLYGVEVKRLNEQVKRNMDRFPTDFMFQCNSSDLENLRSQIATTKQTSNWNFMRRELPYVFTENGVAMLSSVLHSKQAVQINIGIMRIFTKLRSYLLLEKEINHNIQRLEQDVSEVFKVVFQRLDGLEEIVHPIHTHMGKKKKIGIKV
jgi:hypothetical protein